LALSSREASACSACPAAAAAAPATRTSKVIPASLWPGIEQAPVIALATVPTSRVAFWPGLRSGVLGPPSIARLCTVAPWFTTSRVTGVPAGTSTDAGTTAISLSTTLNDCGEPSATWVAAAGAGAPAVSSLPTRPRMFPSSIAVTSRTSPSTATPRRSTSCSKLKLDRWSSSVCVDLGEAAMTVPSHVIQSVRASGTAARGLALLPLLQRRRVGAGSAEGPPGPGTYGSTGPNQKRAADSPLWMTLDGWDLRPWLTGRSSATLDAPADAWAR
jgi:hypothetical protein